MATISDRQNYPHKQLLIEPHGEGFLVEHPILSLDTLDQANFNFCSGVSDLFFGPVGRAPTQQTLMSQEAFNILKWRGLPGSFLPCPYFRSISLGSLSVELLPSGAGAGAALVHIARGHPKGDEPPEQSLLYAHRWSNFSSRAVRQIAPKRANELLFKLVRDPSTLSRSSERRELSRFLELATTLCSAGEWVVVVAPSLGPTHILLNEFHNRGVRVYLDSWNTKSIQALKMESSLEDIPGWANGARKLTNRPPADTPGLILLSREGLWQSPPKGLPRAVWYWIGEKSDERSPTLNGIGFSDTFPIQFLPDTADCLELAQRVNPKKVTITGPGADTLAASLSRLGLPAHVQAPAMMTLF